MNSDRVAASGECRGGGALPAPALSVRRGGQSKGRGSGGVPQSFSSALGRGGELVGDDAPALPDLLSRPRESTTRRRGQLMIDDLRQAELVHATRSATQSDADDPAGEVAVD